MAPKKNHFRCLIFIISNRVLTSYANSPCKQFKLISRKGRVWNSEQILKTKYNFIPIDFMINLTRKTCYAHIFRRPRRSELSSWVARWRLRGMASDPRYLRRWRRSNDFRRNESRETSISYSGPFMIKISNFINVLIE